MGLCDCRYKCLQLLYDLVGFDNENTEGVKNTRKVGLNWVL